MGRGTERLEGMLGVTGHRMDTKGHNRHGQMGVETHTSRTGALRFTEGQGSKRSRVKENRIVEDEQYS